MTHEEIAGPEPMVVAPDYIPFDMQRSVNADDRIDMRLIFAALRQNLASLEMFDGPHYLRDSVSDLRQRRHIFTTPVDYGGAPTSRTIFVAINDEQMIDEPGEPLQTQRAMYSYAVDPQNNRISSSGISRVRRQFGTAESWRALDGRFSPLIVNKSGMVSIWSMQGVDTRPPHTDYAHESPTIVQEQRRRDAAALQSILGAVTLRDEVENCFLDASSVLKSRGGKR